MTAPGSATPTAARAGLAGFLAPIVEGWRLVVRVVAAVFVVALVVLLVLPPRYRASVVLATVASSRVPNLALGAAGDLSDLAGALTGGGIQRGSLQASPQLVRELLGMNSVVVQVGTSPVPGSTRRVVDAVAGKDSGAVKPMRIAEVMRDVIGTDISDRTGLITLAVTHRDSALARLVLGRIIAETRREFVATTRAQASEMRAAQETRVDSAQRQQRHAELELAAFRRTHRVVAEFSDDAIQEGALTQNVTIARQVYGQAVAAREAAVAQELEETPAVVVVDAVPAVIPVVPRHRAMKLALSSLAAFLVAALYLVARDAADERAHDPALQRLRVAVAALPGFTRRKSG